MKGTKIQLPDGRIVTDYTLFDATNHALNVKKSASNKISSSPAIKGRAPIPQYDGSRSPRPDYESLLQFDGSGSPRRDRDYGSIANRPATTGSKKRTAEVSSPAKSPNVLVPATAESQQKRLKGRF